MGPAPSERYKVFPPRWRHLLLPTSSRAAALATLSMWSPCRGRGLLLQRLGWAAVGALGVGCLPGRAVPWAPPWGEATGAQLMAEWRAVIGDVEAVGIYERTQRARSGVAMLLLRRGSPVGFVKLRATEEGAVHPVLRHEHVVLEVIDAAPATAFAHPHPMGIGVVGRWSYLLTTAMRPGLDRPSVREDGGAVLTDIRAGLARLPRGEDVSAGWEPMHGDLTPWNLRVRRGGELTLVDWEDAGWGPPGADAALLYASRQALFGTPPPPVPPEAARYWLQRIADRPADPIDTRLRLDLLASLRDIAG